MDRFGLRLGLKFVSTLGLCLEFVFTDKKMHIKVVIDMQNTEEHLFSFNFLLPSTCMFVI